MFYVVTNDKRVPLDLLGSKDYELWTLDEFIEKATSEEEGLEVGDGGLYVNIEVLTKDLYEALVEYLEEFKIVFYKFDDMQSKLSFNILQPVVEYKTKIEPKVEPKVEEEPVVEEEVEEVEEVEEDLEPENDVVETVEEVKEESEHEKEPEEEIESIEGLNLITANKTKIDGQIADFTNLFDDDVTTKVSTEPAKVYVFGSLKGGVGKSTTCVMTAHNFAKKNPNLRVAVCDLDLSDGQVSPLINKVRPTLGDYYLKYSKGNIGQDQEEKSVIFKNTSVKSDKFPSNVDFYLAPLVEVTKVTEDDKFWNLVIEQLLLNYDVVFFDSGTEYLTKAVISKVYKIADRIVLISNTSISSVKSVLKQLKNLGGIIKNNVYSPEEDILSKVNIVLTRASENKDITQIVVNQFKPYAPISAAFGSLEGLIEGVQWYQRYQHIYDYPQVVNALDKITNLD